MDYRLRHLPFFAKLGVTGIVLTLFIGLWASARHIVDHYENRDERPGLSQDDFVAAYSGLASPAPIQTVVERGHATPVQMDLAAPARASLLRWLAADRVAENYDNIDFADPTPRDLLTTSCVKCHAARSDDARARLLPLDTWEGVKRFAFSRRFDRTPDKVKAISTHTHALALATLAIAVGALGLATSFSRRFVSILIGIVGIALVADVGSWWLANQSKAFVPVIVGAGAAFNAALVLLLVLILIDPWLPHKHPPVA